jgi:uncharacterized membrane protein YfcA
MDTLAAVLLALGGLLAGFLAGVFGIGGGIVLVPVLLYYLHLTGVSSLVATHVAMGTSLLVVMFASCAQAWGYWRANQVIWRGVVLIALGGVVGALLGSSIAAVLEGPSLRKIFGFVLLVAVARLFAGKRKPGKEPEPELALPRLIGTGFLLGMVSSLSGVGGSLIAIPLLYTQLHFPLRKAFGTSSAAIVVTAASGAALYLIRGWGNEFLPPGIPGFVDWRPAIPLILGAVPGAILGTRLSARADTPQVRIVYAVMLLVVTLRMFFF